MIVLGMRRAQHVAVVEMEGTIGSRIKAAEYVKLFRTLGDNERTRAVVLDVDSPGGTAPASDYLYLAIEELGKKKPVVAFIRGTGASGAYLLSCAAAKIVAIPSAIVGSIGVISMRPLIYDAMARIGMRMAVTKSDRFKDMGSMFREPTDEEQAKEQALVDELHGHFIDAVAAGRSMDRDIVRQIATGEIYTARKGHELGLIDELGDLERAIDLAAEMGNVARRPVWVRPKRGLRDLASTLVIGSVFDEVANRLEDRLFRNLYQQRYM